VAEFFLVLRFSLPILILLTTPYSIIYQPGPVKQTPWLVVRKRTIPAERPPLVGEVLFYSLSGGGVQLGPLGTAATDWLIVACPR
jgi:hypothetical protein